ncbi:MAG: guanylate kinase [Candidatus Hydrogenedentes bacterium]|nr:guanylate kinase [Candidatus Hydrogenedentota bacterium]
MSVETDREVKRSPASGLVIIISAPSGAGKDTILRRVLARDPRIAYSISMTTRAPRCGERDGYDYYFVDCATFERVRDSGGLFEWAEVHGNLYGTPREEVDRLTASGKDVILELDVQGMRNVREAGVDAATIFIMAPSIEELERRLTARATDSAEEIARRVARAREEIKERHEFDYIVINDDLNTAVEDLEAIIRSQRLRSSRQP